MTQAQKMWKTDFFDYLKTTIFYTIVECGPTIIIYPIINLVKRTQSDNNQ